MRRTLVALFILTHTVTLAQTQKVTGRVVSAMEPTGIPGVNAVVKGTTQGSITDMDGRFAIEVTPGSVLIFSFVGYKTQELNYTGQTDLTITLEEDSKILNEVVVTGYTSMERKDITGSVATVQSSSFKDISLNGVDQALQGQAPGVQVTQSSGTPGGGVSVHIRGATSISASNNPLYIIDGIQVEVGALSERDFGGQNDNALSLINPNDIESITILKDASAKALYGSRASNGVVIIKTKRGKNSKTKITLDVQRGIINPVKKLSLMNASQLLDLQREAVTNAGQNPDALGLIPGVTDAVNTDWQKEVLRSAILQQYQLSATGGDDNTTFYMSASYRDEEGIQLNNKFQRLGLTLNLDQKLTEKLSVGTNLIISRGFNKRVKGDNFLDGVYSGAIKSLPFNTPYDENGALVGPGSILYAGFPNFNPVGQALLPRFDVLTVKILGGINATYQFNKDLRLKAQTSLDYNNSTEDQYESSQTAIGGFLPSVGGQGYGVFTATTTANVVSFATLSYAKSFTNHSISAIAGTELNQTFSNSGSVQGRLFPSDDFTYIQSAGIVDNGSSSKTPPHNLLSFFGEGKYDFRDKINLSASLRADGSSNFGPNHKFGYFPTVAAGWRISQEKFFHAPSINNLKLRGSFGLSGNERIPQFTYLATWASAPYNGGSGVVPTNTANPNIKWETTRELNFGVDIGLFGDRIQSTVDVYYNKTYDLLLNRPYPFTTGFPGIFDNIGQMENKGIEFSVTSVNIITGGLRWTTMFNISKNLNKILFLADTIPLYRGYTAAGVDGTNIITKGQPLGSFWGLNYLGVNPATGNAMYQDRNKDGIINGADAMVIGNAQPKFIGGITNRFQYKGFDMSILFNFSFGNKVLNFSKASLVNMGGDIQTNQSTDALRRWQKPGDITDIPKYELNSTVNNLHSNRLLEDASYLRLKNLSMGYNLPQKLLARFMLDQVRVYVTATNLLTFTKYSGADPEVSTLDGSTSAQGIDFFTLPQVKTISIGLNATLK